MASKFIANIAFSTKKELSRSTVDKRDLSKVGSVGKGCNIKRNLKFVICQRNGRQRSVVLTAVYTTADLLDVQEQIGFTELYTFLFRNGGFYFFLEFNTLNDVKRVFSNITSCIIIM